MDEYITFDIKTFFNEFKKNFKWIFAFILIFTAVIFLLSLLLPDKYESSVVITRSYLIYAPEKMKIYKPMEFYREFSMSDEIVDSVKKEAVKRGIIEESVNLKEVFSSELFYKPVTASEKVISIKLTATYGDPETAARLVNLWAKIFLKKSSENFTKNSFSDLNATIKIYEGLRKKIGKLQEEKVNLEETYTEKIGSEMAKWSRRIELFTSKYPVDFWKDELEEIKDKIIDFSDELTDIKASIKNLEGRVEEEKNEIKRGEKTFFLKKNIDENGLWILLGSVKNKEDLMKGLKKLNLGEEVLNQSYLTLLEKYVSDKTDLLGLKKKRDYMKTKLKALKEDLKEKEKLIAEKEYALNNLITRKKTIINKLNTEKSEKEKNIDMEIDLLKTGMKKIEDKYLLAKKISLSNFSEIKIASHGVPPEGKSFPPRFLITMVAFFVAIILSFVFLFLKVVFKE